jgi:nitric oxide reductase large subunit
VPSKSAARAFFLLGIIGFAAVFLLLTINTIRCVPAQTKQQHLTEQVVHGKHLWEHNNCMGYHTLFGEGAYYAPELTKKQIPRSLRRNGLPVKRIDRALLMRHEHLAGAPVELLEGAETAPRPNSVLHHPPEAFDRVEVVATMGG